MDEIWQAVSDLALELHPDRLESVVRKLKSSESIDSFSELRAALGPNTDSALIDRLKIVWDSLGNLSANEVIAAIQGAKATAALAGSRGSVELVWTGPSTGFVPVRHTERVLCDVIESARRRLFIVSYVVYEVTSVAKALRGAVGRQVRIDVLVERTEEQGGSVTYDSIKKMKETVPSANVYVWKSKMEEAASIRRGSVHAKCVVADGERAFISSANLSTAAMARNMELGVLIDGGALPYTLDKHLDALIDTGTIERL